jgi:hypothetical protein
MSQLPGGGDAYGVAIAAAMDLPRLLQHRRATRRYLPASASAANTLSEAQKLNSQNAHVIAPFHITWSNSIFSPFDKSNICFDRKLANET